MHPLRGATWDLNDFTGGVAPLNHRLQASSASGATALGNPLYSGPVSWGSGARAPGCPLSPSSKPCYTWVRVKGMLVTLVKAAAIGMGALLALKLMVVWIEPRLVFRPSRGLSLRPSDLGIPYQEHRIRTSDGEELVAW